MSKHSLALGSFSNYLLGEVERLRIFLTGEPVKETSCVPFLLPESWNFEMLHPFLFIGEGDICLLSVALNRTIDVFLDE